MFVRRPCASYVGGGEGELGKKKVLKNAREKKKKNRTITARVLGERNRLTSVFCLFLRVEDVWHSCPTVLEKRRQQKWQLANQVSLFSLHPSDYAFFVVHWDQLCARNL